MTREKHKKNREEQGRKGRNREKQERTGKEQRSGEEQGRNVEGIGKSRKQQERTGKDQGREQQERGSATTAVKHGRTWTGHWRSGGKQ